MAHKETIVHQEIVKEEVPTDAEDSPMVLAYRVGRLEKAQEAGFKHISDELKDLKAGFVTTKELEEEVDKAKLIHDGMTQEYRAADKALDARLQRIESVFNLIGKIIIWVIVCALLALLGLKAFGVTP